MANGVHKITEDFEKALSDYTGAPYVVCLDNMSNDISWVNKTIDFVPDYLKELEKIDDKTVDCFVDFWKKKLIIE